jgi:pimeloyl-ACP methyl ester carboxylesterase
MTVMELIANGQMEKATEEFMEKIGMGEGSWEKLPEVVQKICINNAPTWFDEIQDPDALQMNLTSLSNFNKRVLLSTGTESPPFFPLVTDQLMAAIPQAKRITIEGAGHVPHMSHPAQYIELLRNFCVGV